MNKQILKEENVVTLLDTCTQLRVFFFEKKGKGYNIYLFPNDVTEDIRSDIVSLYRSYVNGKEVIDYSLTDAKKETIQKLPTTELPQWDSIKKQIDGFPLTGASILTPDNITPKIKMYVIECTINDNILYIVSKFSHGKTYGKKIWFSMFGHTFQKIDNVALTLGDSIDCFIYENDVYILVEPHFDSIFAFYKKINDDVMAKITEIDTWDFFNNHSDIGGALIDKPRKGRQFLKVLGSDNLMVWKTKTPQERKLIISNDNKLKNKFQFDEDDKMVFTNNSLNELFKLLTDDYFKSIITGETGER